MLIAVLPVLGHCAAPISLDLGSRSDLALPWLSKFTLALSDGGEVALLAERTDRVPHIALEVLSEEGVSLCRSSFTYFAACLVNPGASRTLTLEVSCPDLCGCSATNHSCIDSCSETCPVALLARPDNVQHVNSSSQVQLKGADHPTVSFLHAQYTGLQSVSASTLSYDYYATIYVNKEGLPTNRTSFGTRIDSGSAIVAQSPCYIVVYHSADAKLTFSQSQNIKSQGVYVFSMQNKSTAQDIFVSEQYQRLFVSVLVLTGSANFSLTGCNNSVLQPMSSKWVFLLQDSQLASCKPAANSSGLRLMAQTHSEVTYQVTVSDYKMMYEGWSSPLHGNTSRNITSMEAVVLEFSAEKGSPQYCLTKGDFANWSSCLKSYQLEQEQVYNLATRCQSSCEAVLSVRRLPISLKLGQNKFVFLDSGQRAVVKVEVQQNYDQVIVSYETLQGQVQSSVDLSNRTTINNVVKGVYQVTISALQSSSVYFSSSVPGNSTSTKTFYVAQEPTNVSLVAQGSAVIRLKVTAPLKVKVQSDLPVCFSFGYFSNQLTNCTQPSLTLELPVLQEKLLRVELNGTVNLQLSGSPVDSLERGHIYTVVCDNCTKTVVVEYHDKDMLSVSGDGYILDGKEVTQENSVSLSCARKICEQMVELVVPNSAYKKDGHFTSLTLTGESGARRLFQSPQRVFLKQAQPLHFWFVSRGKFVLFAQAQSLIPRLLLAKSKDSSLDVSQQKFYPSSENPNSYSQTSEDDPFRRWTYIPVQNNDEESLVLVTVEPNPAMIFSPGPIVLEVRHSAQLLDPTNQTLQYSVAPSLFLLRKKAEADDVVFRSHSSVAPQSVYSKDGLIAFICHDSCVFSVFQKNVSLGVRQLHANDPIVIAQEQALLINTQEGMRLTSNGSFEMTAKHADSLQQLNAAEFTPCSPQAFSKKKGSFAMLKVKPHQPIVLVLSRGSIFVESGADYNFSCSPEESFQFVYFASDPFFVTTQNLFRRLPQQNKYTGHQTYFPQFFSQYKFQVDCDKQKRIQFRVDDSGSSGGRPLFPMIPVFGNITAASPRFCVMHKSEVEGGNFSLTVVGTNASQNMSLHGVYYVSPVNASRKVVSAWTIQSSPHSISFLFDRVKGSYQICFQNKEGDLDLYAVVAGQNSSVIAPGLKQYKWMNKSRKQVYQIVVPQKTNYKLQVTNCLGENKFYGSSNYTSVVVGGANQITNVVQRKNMSVADLDLYRGYFYLALQAITNSFVRLQLVQKQITPAVVLPPSNVSLILRKLSKKLEVEFHRAECAQCKGLSYQAVISRSNESLNKYLLCDFTDEFTKVFKEPKSRVLAEAPPMILIEDGALPNKFAVTVVVRDSGSGLAYPLYEPRYIQNYYQIEQQYRLRAEFYYLSLLLIFVLVLSVSLRVCRRKKACCFRVQNEMVYEDTTPADLPNDQVEMTEPQRPTTALNGQQYRQFVEEQRI